MNKKEIKKKLEKNISSAEYNLVGFLDKIGLIFKYSFFLFLVTVFFYIIYIFSFSLDSLTKLKSNSKFNKGVINISFKNKDDYKLSLKEIKVFNSLLYNKTNSFKSNYDNKFIPLYQIDFKSRGILFSLRDNFNEEDLLKDEFYILKSKKDDSAYRRDSIITPKISELYSGKIVFESFFEFPYIDFINLISGILFSDELYRFKYSQKLSKLALNAMKQKDGFFISSYNNTDSTSHKDLLKSFSIYYKSSDFIKSIESGNYFLANELIISGKQFNFELKNNYLYYDIFYKEKDFKILIFKDGTKIVTSYQNHNKFKLKKGTYRILILKLENNLLFTNELFAYYFNIQIN